MKQTGSPRVITSPLSSTLARWAKRSLVVLALSIPMMFLSSEAKAAPYGKKPGRPGVKTTMGTLCYDASIPNVPVGPNGYSTTKDITLIADQGGTEQVVSEMRTLTLTYTKTTNPNVKFVFYR